MSSRHHSMFAVAAIILAGCSMGTEPDASVDTADQDIVRGDTDNGHLAVMALEIPRLDGTDTLCTGTLYAPHTIVTAAHCLENAAAVFAYFGNNFNVDLGQLADDPATWKNFRLAVDWQAHPSWDRTTLNADIAIIHIDRDVPFAPIKLDPYEVGASQLNKPADIVGYGATGVDATGAPVNAYLKRHGLTTYQGSPKASPLPPHPHPGLSNPSIRAQLMQFAGSGRNANACFGDSGGPALMPVSGDQRIVGVASWTGDNCEKFSYYVRVQTFLSFLQKAAR